MMRFLGNFAGILLALIVFIGCIAAFAVYTATRSHPPADAYVYSGLVKDSVAIYRSQFGIPHIIAGSEGDAYFALGYTHAQDRMWQMDMMRRAGSGRLSEVLGHDAVVVDKFMRSIGISSTVKKIYPRLSKTSKFILQSYSNGVNAYIEEQGSSLPFEFDALNYRPEKWDPSDCLIIGRAMAFEMSLGFWSDMAFGKIADKIGPERAAELVPGYPDYAPTLMEQGKPRPKPQAPDSLMTKDSLQKKDTLNPMNGHGQDSLKADTTIFNFLKKKKKPAPQSDAAMKKAVSELQEVIEKTREYLGIRGSAIGSNAWVMKKTAAKNSGVILANDPHLTLTAPARWYQAHLTTPTMNVVGMTIPGLPLFVAGRNNRIAWGITNTMADDVDFFIEQLDSTKKDFYVNAAGKRTKFKYQRDTVKIRGQEPMVFDLRMTNRSAVISDVHLFRKPSAVFPGVSDSSANYYYNKYCITFSWTGNVFSDEILSLYKINKSRSWKEFTDGVNGWGSPALNFTYADAAGNFGIAPSGVIPKRGPQCNPNFPNQGWKPETAWQGYYSGASLPRTLNPQRRYIASANNKISHTLPFFISSLWEPPSRAQRIEELLTQFDAYSVKDAQFMQNDVNSPFAREVLEISLPVLNSMQKRLDSTELRALWLFQKWEGTMTSQDAAPLLFSVFMDRILKNTFMDDLGEFSYRQYTYISNVPTRRILEFMQDTSSVWFDDARTRRKENRNEVIRSSFREAVDILVKNFENERPNQWKFGNYHTLTIPHIFSMNSYLKPAVTLGPFPSNGNNTTLNNGEWKFSDPYRQVIGASMRFIADMQDSVVISVLPGGISGQPLSAHYADQLQLWLNGGYVRTPVSGNRPETYRSYTRISNKKLEE